ncbi:MAG: site-2 protease family protein [Bacteroidota bacterium]
MLEDTTRSELVVTLKRERESQGEELIEAIVELDEQRRLGIFFEPVIQYSEKRYSLAQSIVPGTKNAFGIILHNIQAFVRLFNNELSVEKSIRGPVGVAKAYGSDQSLFGLRFWRVMGIWSMVTVFWNLLPLPKSTIWQSVPLLYEWISNKPFNRRSYDRLVNSPYFLAAGLMIYILVGDILSILF